MFSKSLPYLQGSEALFYVYTDLLHPASELGVGNAGQGISGLTIKSGETGHK